MASIINYQDDDSSAPNASMKGNVDLRLAIECLFKGTDNPDDIYLSVVEPSEFCQWKPINTTQHRLDVLASLGAAIEILKKQL